MTLLPNFFIAGGARCGSTSLENYCRAHPQVFMSSIKEPNYFSYGSGRVPFAGPGRARAYSCSVRDIHRYRALFREAGTASAIGEASINYLLHPEACSAMHREIPGAKLIFILRQPVDRAWSSFQYSRCHGTEKETDFLSAWQDDQRRRKAGYWSCLHRHKSLYGQHLKVWFDTFPCEQIKVILFEDFKADTAAVMRDVFSFLDIDANFVPDTSVVHNRSGVIANPALRLLWHRTAPLRAAIVPIMPMKWRGRMFRLVASQPVASNSRPKLPDELKATLTEELRDDILALQQLTGHDLSGWFSLQAG
jgi:Sulfotransferase domain